MTISSIISEIKYNGNDVTTSFSFPSLFFEDTHLEVIQISAAGVETVLTLTTHYSVTGMGNSSGGTVVMVTAVPSGEKLYIHRVVPMTQETDYVTGDAFPAETHEKALDLLTMITQQVSETVGKSVRLSASSLGVDTELPSPAAGHVIGWNTAEDALTNLTVDSNVIYVNAVAPDETVYPLWYDTSVSDLKFWNGSVWMSTSGGDMLRADNLSNVASAATSLANIGGEPADATIVKAPLGLLPPLDGSNLVNLPTRVLIFNDQPIVDVANISWTGLSEYSSVFIVGVLSVADLTGFQISGRSAGGTWRDTGLITQKTLLNNLPIGFSIEVVNLNNSQEKVISIQSTTGSVLAISPDAMTKQSKKSRHRTAYASWAEIWDEVKITPMTGSFLGTNAATRGRVFIYGVRV